VLHCQLRHGGEAHGTLLKSKELVLEVGHFGLSRYMLALRLAFPLYLDEYVVPPAPSRSPLTKCVARDAGKLAEMESNVRAQRLASAKARKL